MAYKVRDLIFDALLEIGEVDPVDPLDEDNLAVGLKYVLLMADTLQARRLLLFTRAAYVFVLTPNQQTQTIGKGGQLDTLTTPRPIWISGIGVIPAGDSFEIPVGRYTQEEWRNEPLKTLTDTYPQRFLYDPNWTPGVDLGAITWWPAPTSAPKVNIYVPAPLLSLATPDTVLDFPPGYSEAWKFNLAKRLCRPYRKALTPDLVEDARTSLALLERLNDPGPPPAKTDPCGGSGGGYDIRTNTYR